MNYWTESNDNIYVAAHRGWSSEYPENTMIAFKKAVELGVDQLETDVRVTRDGELVLMHDETVDRTTNGTGKVRDKLLGEIMALDAGIKKGEQFAGTRVPTFKEFMDYAATVDGLTLDIELKERPDKIEPATAFDVCDRVLKMVDDYGFTDRVVINTFSGALHEYIEDKYGDKYRRHVYYPCSYLGKVTRDPYANAYCCCMFPAFYTKDIATKIECDVMKNLGVEPWAGAGIKDEAGVKKAIENGAALITCNNPDVILEALRKFGKHK